MKKRIKTGLSCLLILLLVLCTMQTAFAQDGNVAFRGKVEEASAKAFTFSPGSSFTATDLFDNFKGLMPGDSRTQEITFTNADPDSTVALLYMQAVPHDDVTNLPKSGVTTAASDDLLSKLQIKVWKNAKTEENLVYDNSEGGVDLLTNGILLGEFKPQQTSTVIFAEVTVPLDLGNDYANRIGEIDWKFTAESFYQQDQITVHKVWGDGSWNKHEKDSVEVALVADAKDDGSEGTVTKTVTLDKGNNWTYTFDKLKNDHTWSVRELNVPAGYTPSYKTDGNVVTITNNPNYTPAPSINYTVEKQWAGNDKNPNAAPSSVSVQLYMGSAPYGDPVTLSSANGWTYTWLGLSSSYSWSVREVSVPEGYTASYATVGNKTIITNTYGEEETEPGTLQVKKVWKDDGKDRPGSVRVDLLRDGKVYRTVKLSKANKWTYTWKDLDRQYSWSAVESSVPSGYEVSYKAKGDQIVITNTQKEEVKEPVSLTVTKKWKGDLLKDRPDEVKVTLYDGDDKVAVVRLNEDNDWTYTWENLSGEGNWQVLEKNVPKGYKASYKTDGDTVTITNTASLIQTGQLNWPIPVLGGLGLLLILAGLLVSKKKKQQGAQ